MHPPIRKVKGMSQRNQEVARRKIKMQKLRDQGFSDTEIARLVNRSPERVGQVLGRKKPRAKHVVSDDYRKPTMKAMTP